MRTSRRRNTLLLYVVLFALILASLVVRKLGLYHTIHYHLRNVINNSGYVPCGFRKLPLIHVYNEDHVVIVWETNCQLSQVRFFYWYNGGEGNVRSTHAIDAIRLDETHWLYRVKVGPLLEQGEYTYLAVSKEMHTEDYAFSHLPRPRANGEPIRVACLADNQYGLPVFSRLLSQVAKHRPNHLIHAGDGVQTFSDLREWQTNFFDPLSFSGLGPRTPIIYAHGNHDMDEQKRYVYTNGRLWFAFNLGGARIIVLDSNIDDLSQDEFLRQELSSPASISAIFRIVIVHIPPFIEFWDPQAWNQKGEKHWGEFVRTRFVPLFQSGKVDLVISGHQHNYQRGSAGGITYAIVGGAGGALDFDRVADWGMYTKIESRHHFVMIELSGSDGGATPRSGKAVVPASDIEGATNSRLVWTAYGIEGDVIDRFVLTQRPKDKR